MQGDAADIREVYSLIDRSKAELIAAFNDHSRRTEATLNRLTTQMETTITRLQSHIDLPHHPSTATEIVKIRIQLAKWGGGLAVLIGLATAVVKFIPG